MDNHSPWKGVWQPEAGTGGGVTGANGDKVYVSSSSGGNKGRAYTWNSKKVII